MDTSETGAPAVPLVAPKIVPKPWGREIWYAHEERYAGKILEVTRGHALSLQKHERKQETMYLLSGLVLYHMNGQDFEFHPGQCLTVRPGDVHLRSRPGRQGLIGHPTAPVHRRPTAVRPRGRPGARGPGGG